MIIRKSVTRRLLVTLVGAALVGCVGCVVGCGDSSSGDASAGRHVAKAPTERSHRPWRTQLAAPAIAACVRAVSKAAASLSASARGELAEPCRTMDERVHENEALVRAVCQELASATSPAPDAPDVKQTEAECYAEYAKTIPVEERLPGSSSG